MFYYLLKTHDIALGFPFLFRAKPHHQLLLRECSSQKYSQVYSALSLEEAQGLLNQPQSGVPQDPKRIIPPSHEPLGVRKCRSSFSVIFC